MPGSHWLRCRLIHWMHRRMRLRHITDRPLPQRPARKLKWQFVEATPLPHLLWPGSEKVNWTLSGDGLHGLSCFQKRMR